MALSSNQVGIPFLGAPQYSTQVDDWGFVNEAPGGGTPALLRMSDPTQVKTAGFLDELSTFGANLWDNVGDAASSVGSAASQGLDLVELGLKTTYNSAQSALKDTVSAVTDEAKETTDFAVSRVILIVLALGAVIYLAGKSGAVRLTKIT